MGKILWIYAAIILSVSETWSIIPGTNYSMPVNTSTTSHPKVYVVKNVTLSLGTDVNLTCSDKMWNETLYVIWKIHNHKYCEIGFSNGDKSTDSCNDGKSLQNTSSSQPYLHIPNMTTSDRGVYKCEWVYNGGIESYVINVAVAVPPTVLVWLEQRGNKMVAVCKAERGKPAANISWSYTGNHKIDSTLDSDGFFTVISHLEIPEDMDAKNLSCTVRNQYWQHEQILVLKPKAVFPWLCIAVIAVVVLLVGLLFFAQKKLAMLRQCAQSHTSSSKSPPTEDVEEVEPYASYVQRVNSIYNSSADFCSHKNPAHRSHAHACTEHFVRN